MMLFSNCKTNHHAIIVLVHLYLSLFVVFRREGEASRLRRQLRLLWKTLCVLLLVGVLISAFATLLATVELRRHLGRMFFALPLMLHLLLDAIAALAPLLAAENDGQGEPPPPRPTSQVRRVYGRGADERAIRFGKVFAESSLSRETL